MSTEVLTVTLAGLRGTVAPVKASTAPSFEIAGLPAEHTRRGVTVRVLAALRMTRHGCPVRVEVPPGAGASADLAIALAVLVQLGQVDVEALDGFVVLGELALSGAVRPVRGALPALLAARAAGHKGALVPRANAPEASSVVAPGFEVRTISELHLADRFLERYDQLEPNVAPLEELPAVRPEVSGLSLRAEGTTLVLLRGPYGCWSTLAAHSLPGLVTGFEHDRETASCIYSLSGLGLPAGTLVRPPFRAPHYSISEAALAGSASHNRPGEIALAHGGVLFLDELHEFSRPACQALVNVLRHGVDRGGFPARPRIVAAFAPPCICGYYHDRREKCRCTEEQVQRHEARLHAEWMPRFDHEVWL